MLDSLTTKQNNQITHRSLPLLVLLFELLALVCFVFYPILAFPHLREPNANLGQFLIPYGVGLLYLVTGLWVYFLRRRDSTGLTFSLWSGATAIVFAGLFDHLNTQTLLYGWSIALGIAGGGLLNLGLLVPVEVSFLRRYPFLRWLSYLPALAASLILLLAVLQPASAPDLNVLLQIEALYLRLAAVVFLALNLRRRLTHPSPLVRENARQLLWGAVLSFAPAGLWFMAGLIWPSLSFSPALLLPAGIFPLVTAVVVLRHRLLNTDFLLSQGLLYALMSILAASGYALLVGGLSLVIGSTLPADNPFLIGLMVLIVAVVFNPARLRLQRLIDVFFFRGQAAYRERLEAFTSSLTGAAELEEILQRLRESVWEGLFPSLLHLFIYDPISGHYSSIPRAVGEPPSSDLSFPADSPLVLTLSARRNTFILSEGEALPTALAPERTRLALLGAQLFIPLPGRQRLAGWLALGPRRSGEAYNSRDLNYLQALCDQAALAVERSQVVGDLERRVHEMNVLTRIAQGLNVTLEFDDILELIYAQTSQVIPCKDFWITLYRPEINLHSYVFFLQNDERLPQLENTPILEGQGLEGVIWRERRALLTEDYERECRQRGVSASISGVYAWMGAPLNTSSDTIGTLSLASRDPAVTFTASQAALLQAIADQVAGAMVKARLLQETERRARHMASLNEIGRKISSTLEHRPLLDSILKSAVDILNCEAGSLFLVDESTGELVFEVTAGPVAEDLLGQRLPPGAGLVGRAVATGKPVIANQVQTEKGWFDKADQQTGFVTQNLLVVPMHVKDKVIGVIEVINKKDGSPFTAEDQDFLSTFSSQAAVAVENSRLYTQTDRALEARVEELSVLQRIGRELNSSLDLEHTLQITLDWAARQTMADAGLVGLIGDEGLEIMAIKGYSIELEPYLPGPEASHPVLPVELPALQTILGSPMPQVSSLTTSAEAPTVPIPSRALQDPALLKTLAQQGFLLAGARRQAAVPIWREGEVRAVMILESRRLDAFSEENLIFLARLSDQAAMAVANAHLYEAVQAANVAKSEFISFVSHELKTPMTSIKGYADLLSAGAVGPVNEAQANFLNTIRSNVNRMAALVSDLSDISRIESGRLKLDFSSVQVDELVNEVIRAVRSSIDEKSQTLEVQIPANLPPIWGDRNRLIQILTNLISNANKYSPAEGYISVSAECIDNHLDPKGSPRVIHISVRDTGYGIQPSDQKRIFQKFFRSEDPNIRSSPGTGLGLNITRHLVEIQGGQIWFESQPGEGSIFHFTAPISTS